MRHRFVIFLVLAALVVSLQGPAAAQKKKKKAKGPKPYVSETVTIAVAHPVFYGTTGAPRAVTAAEFEATCALPSSNGLDAYVFEVPAAYQKIDSTITTVSSGGPAGYDIDMYLYGEDCTVSLAYNSESIDETGVMPKGTHFVLLHNYLGGPVETSFELRP